MNPSDDPLDQSITQKFKQISLVLIVNAIALVVLGGWSAYSLYRIANPVYEFRLEFISESSSINSTLNNYGAEGWSVVSYRKAEGATREWGAEVMMQRIKR